MFESISNDKNILLIKNQILNTSLKNRVFLWGGYLRDLYFGINPKDIDMLVIIDEELKDSCLKLISNVFKVCESSIIKTSPATIQFRFKGLTIDIRLAFLKSGDMIENLILENLKTFDFTINALSQNISTGEMLDLTGRSFIDLKEKNLRLVNDSLEETFHSYPNRIYRLIRLSCMFDLKIPPYILTYIKNNPHIINFIDRNLLIEEYNRIANSSHIKDGLDYLNLLNINPKSFNRTMIYFGTGWNEIEPGQIPKRIIEGNKFRWSSDKSEILICPDVRALKIKFIQNSQNPDFSVNYFTNQNSLNLYKMDSKSGINTFIFDVENVKKLTIKSSTFVPDLIEKNKDFRNLGIRLIGTTVFTKSGEIEIPIENIPYIL